MEKQTDLLIIGAGPFGLAMAAYAADLGLDYLMVGKPMGFWRDQMPAGMFLRSAADWHLDPTGRCTIERFLQTRSLTPADGEPLSLQTYLSYTDWVQEEAHLVPLPRQVERLDQIDVAQARFRASLENGDSIIAKHVVIAVGFKYFRHIPQDLVDRLPPGCFAHTCDRVDFKDLGGRRCLIIGGRQSAFEWAALLHEAGAAAVHLSYRHDSPRFAEADWSWVNPLVERTIDEPGWYRRLSPAEQEATNRQLWAEGRLKVEPWLEPRLRTDTVTLWPRTEVVAARELPAGALLVRLDNGEALTVDQIILATGYRVDLSRVPFLVQGDVLPRVTTRNGFPMLDNHLQTNVPGLFITSMAATQDFGPFFAFTVSARASARLLGGALVD